MRQKQALFATVASFLVICHSGSAGMQEYRERLREWVSREVARENDPGFQAAIIQKRAALEEIVKRKGEDGPNQLRALNELGRSYLGTSITRAGRDEQKVVEILTLMRQRYSENEFCYLALRFDLVSPGLGEPSTLDDLVERADLCRWLLQVPADRILDSSRDLSEENEAREFEGLRSCLLHNASDRLKMTVLCIGLDHPFALEQLLAIRRDLSHLPELDGWAQARLEEVEAQREERMRALAEEIAEEIDKALVSEWSTSKSKAFSSGKEIPR